MILLSGDFLEFDSIFFLSPFMSTRMTTYKRRAIKTKKENAGENPDGKGG